MAIRVGYACLALAVPGTRMRGCTLRTLTREKLEAVTAENLAALERLIAYNARLGIRVFRISSDLVPFGSSPANTFPWREAFAGDFRRIGGMIAGSGIRVSMHPGQYTVPGSPDAGVAARSAEDLIYHADVLELLGTDAGSKIVLHLGGAYGDKAAALDRFAENFRRLPQKARERLVLENDERSYTIAEVLEASRRLFVPAVFDILHHKLNPPAEAVPDAEWAARCAATWQPGDGRQKIHYSQQAEGGRPGAHSDTIAAGRFLADIAPFSGMPLDVMLEVKDKNVSAVKCMLCLDAAKGIGALEAEWGRYKYAVLEHSQRHYRQMRALLKDKSAYPAAEFFALAESALETPVTRGSAANAAMHVWGYFNNTASAADRAAFERALSGYMNGETQLEGLKRLLYRHAEASGEEYLLQSYYFI